MRDLPSIEAQLGVISKWLVKFGDRRPSEAAMEVTSMSAPRRRSFFRNLRRAGCIEHGPVGWVAVKGLS